MEEIRNNSGQSLGIAALITAIITFVLAVIPCVGLIAIIPGIIALILSSVGLSQASRNNSPRGVVLAGLIIAIVAVMISLSQIFFVGKIADQASKWPNHIQNIIDDVQDNVIKDIKDDNVSIKVESNGKKVEINTKINRDDQEKKLEDLEEGGSKKKDTVKTVVHTNVRNKK